MDDSLTDWDGAAARLGTTKRHVQLLVRRRELTHVRVGKLYRFRVSDLDAYVASRAVQSQ